MVPVVKMGNGTKIIPADVPLKVVSAGMYGLNLRDAFKGALYATTSAAITALFQLLQTTPLTLDAVSLKGVGIAALTGLVAYLFNKFFSGATVVKVDNS